MDTSFVLVLWLFRGVNWEAVWKPLQNVHWTYICLYLAIMLILQFLRSYRWELLLRPIVSVGQKTLFSVTSVGFLALLVLPARGGEFARPYLLSRKAPISMSAALATIVVERILDILTTFIFLYK